jgi:hypothetical protein
MVAVTATSPGAAPAPGAVDEPVAAPARNIGVVAWGVASFRIITDSKPLPVAMRSVFVDTGSVPVAVRITTDREAREPRADLRMVNSTRAGANPLVVNADPAGARSLSTASRRHSCSGAEPAKSQSCCHPTSPAS